ncbi:MAG: PD-(D/E)XK nuclease family protein [Desulfosalsimonadaceae bacterium]
MTRYQEISHKELQALLQNGAVLVAVNRRLARKQSAEYGDQMLAEGRLAWQSPQVYCYEAWLEKLYDSFLMQLDPAEGGQWPDFLPEGRELWLWEEIVRGSEHGHDLLQAQAAAKTASEAWLLCSQYRLDTDMLANVSPPPDTEAFITWARRFVSWCRAENWVEPARLPDFVAQAVQSGRIVPPETIVFAGFDEFSPQFEDLAAAFRHAGCLLCTLALPRQKTPSACFALPDTETEIYEAARWARNTLEAHPHKRIGVIVPDLASVRTSLVRIFDDVLHPGLVFTADDRLERLYNVSLGPPLADYAMIRTATEVLEHAGGLLAVEEAGRLLQSPFIGGSRAELTRRAVLDAQLRKRGETETALACLPEFAADAGCPILSRLITRYKEISAGLPDAARPSEWAQNFASLLSSLEWPGDRNLSSVEYQTLDAWRGVLSRFAGLDRILGAVCRERALQVLRRMLAEGAFQPESAELPVQVLGVLESAGERFDAAWIMGLHNENWPPSARPNPLIPVWLQRKHNVIHCSANRELSYSRRITQRLLGCAAETIISYPEREGDAGLFASPLISGLQSAEKPPAALEKQEFWRAFLRSAAIEYLCDTSGPEIREDTSVRGGTGLLKAQANCPFSAFARYRLGAEALEIPAPGLDAAERGTLVHRCLQFLWQRLESSEALLTMTEADLQELIEQSGAEAVAAAAAEKPRTFTERFAVVERQRLFLLLKEWLALECQRSAFLVVACEARASVSLCGLRLTAIADRIDRLPDGRFVIIDYKTGKPGLQEWFGERITEPQLPLYAVAQQTPVGGVFFAQVRKGEARFTGIAEEPDLAPGAGDVQKKAGAESIAALLQRWRLQLQSLAEEVKSGYAPVSPVSVNTSCRYCELMPICRIKEKDMLEQEHANNT